MFLFDSLQFKGTSEYSKVPDYIAKWITSGGKEGSKANLMQILGTKIT